MKYSSLTPNPYHKGYVTKSDPRANIKDIDSKQGLVSGYFAAFGNIDAHTDVIDSGAFAKTIKEWGPSGIARIAHLADHNPTKRVAKIIELSEDSHGLLYRSQFLGNNHTLARDTLIEIEAGILKEHSIGFNIIQERRYEETNIFHLQEIRLFEGSHVTWGANMETPIVEVKDLSELPKMVQLFADQMKAIERCLSRGITDEAAIKWENQFEQYDNYLKQVREALAAREPSNDTLNHEPQLKSQILSIIENL